MGNNIGMRNHRIGVNESEETSSTNESATESRRSELSSQCRLNENSKNQQREKVSRRFREDVIPIIKQARVGSDVTQFWLSPFERLPFSEPAIRSYGDYDTNERGICHFPRFLDNLVNQTFRLLMRLLNTNGKPEILESYPEVLYLMRNVKFLKVKLLHHPLGERIKVNVEECHGGRRKKSIRRFRPMYTKFVFLDHVQPSLLIGGEDFFLDLTPARAEAGVNWSDANGNPPTAVGHYMRELDTNPNLVLEWSVAVWKPQNNSQSNDNELNTFEGE